MTPRELSEMLALHAEDICRELLPRGKKVGAEWCVGSISGEPGDSCRIHLAGQKAGVWADFATGQKGDLLTLYSLCRGVTLGEAMRWAREYLGIRDDRDAIIRPIVRRRTVAPPPETGISKYVIDYFSGRGITEKTLKAYRVTSNGTVAAFPAYHGNDVLMVKYRDVAKPKDRAFWASPGGTPALIGWSCVPDDAREIIITEGEIDAMSYYEQGMPALSVPFGAGSGGKHDWIDAELDRLERFDTIYLSMDMDEPGLVARDTIAARLGAHRCRAVDLPEKDANDCHVRGLSLRRYVDAARYLDPHELRPASAYARDVSDMFAGDSPDTIGIPLPWPKTHRHFRLRRGELTIWGGYNGHGKTTLLSNVMVGAMSHGERVLIASMEVRPVLTLYRIYQQAGAVDIASAEYCSQIAEWLNGVLWLVAIHGTAKANRLIEIGRYAWRRFNISHFVVDSLAKCGMAEDDYNAQKLFVEALADLAHETNMHVHLVCHARKGDSEHDAPGKMDVKGTGAISDMADNVCIVWRNKAKEDAPDDAKKPDAILSVVKQRNYDWEGRIALWYDARCHQFLERQDSHAQPFFGGDARMEESCNSL